MQRNIFSVLAGMILLVASLRAEDFRVELVDEQVQTAAATAPAEGQPPPKSLSEFWQPPIAVPVHGHPLCPPDAYSAAPSAYDPYGYCLDDGWCQPRITSRFEYLMWWSRGRNTPPLVTTSPQGTVQDEAGVLDFADTTVLYGAEPIGEDLRSGGRATISYLLDCGYGWADARFWGLGDSTESFFAASDGDPILARPFFNVLTGQEDAFLIAFPGAATDGSISIRSKNDLFGADAWLRQVWYQDCDVRIDLVLGYQFTRLDDSLVINNIQTSIDPLGAFPVGTVVDILDVFAAQNEFHGGQVGFVAEYRGACWTLELLGKIALGGMRERILIDGRTIADEPLNPPGTAPGGLLAQRTNMGIHEGSRVAFIPEVGVNLAYDINPCWRMSFGYSFLYWSNVVLAGDQIDRAVNFSQNPGPIAGDPRPRFTFNRTDYWTQGLNVGLEFRW